ncbi:MAG: helix-turn-helix transcriptional regulator [Bacteroidota bacterium]
MLVSTGAFIGSESSSKLHKLNRIRRQEEFRLENNSRFASLTRREKEIMQMLAEGKNNREIALELFISRNTVDQHRKNIKRKLEVKSFVQLFQYALAFDLI